MEQKVVTMADRTLADWLNEEIQRRHISIREFSRNAGISHMTLSRILSPDTTTYEYPSMDTLVKLARHTKIDLCTLVAMVSPEDTNIDVESRLIAERIAGLPAESRAIIDKYILGSDLESGEEGE